VTSDESIELELPAAHDQVRFARDTMREFLALHGVGKEDVDQLLLIASELLANVVDHGGGDQAILASDLKDGARMHLYCSVSGPSWVLRVSDQGGGSPEEVDALFHPEGLPDLESERGRGLFLITTMCDSVRVCRSGDGLGVTVEVFGTHGGG